MKTLLTLLLILSSFIVQATNFTGCPDSTYCNDSVIALCYNSVNLDTVDEIKFKIQGNGQWLVEKVDSTNSTCIFISNPFLNCSTDIISNIKLYDSSNMQVGSCSQSVALPVELSKFIGYPLDDNSVYISWETSSEFNNSHFILERTLNGLVWENIAMVESINPYSTSLQTYYFIDNNNLDGAAYYYRLKQYDFDGTETISNTILVMTNEIKNYEVEILTNTDIIGRRVGYSNRWKIIRKNNKAKIIIYND